MMTAARIRTDILHPSLDAIALNARQARLIIDPTPEVDSAAEHFAAAARHCTPEGRDHLAAGLALLRQALHANTAERDCERRIAGVADQLAADTHRHAAAAGATVPGVQKIARTLRPHLELLGCDQRFVKPERRAAAEAVVADMVAQVPRAHLLSVGVRHELGVRKFTTLSDFCAEQVA